MRLWPKGRGAAQPLEWAARLTGGARRMPVSLTLDGHAITCHGAGVRLRMNLAERRRIECPSRLVSGAIPHGTILRVSLADRTLEFVIDTHIDQWIRRVPETGFIGTLGDCRMPKRRITTTKRQREQAKRDRRQRKAEARANRNAMPVAGDETQSDGAVSDRDAQ
jgi:hypothetical protein